LKQRTNILKAFYGFFTFSIFFDHKKDLDGISGSFPDDLPGGTPWDKPLSAA
jgi:hypothetical protein